MLIAVVTEVSLTPFYVEAMVVFMMSDGVSDVLVLVLFLHQHNNADPGSTLVLTNCFLCLFI